MIRHYDDLVFDFTVYRPSTPMQIATSDIFLKLAKEYVESEKRRHSKVATFIESCSIKYQLDGPSYLVRLFHELLSKPFEAIEEGTVGKDVMLKIADDLYDHWRHRQRYVLLDDSLTNDRYELLEAIDRFSRLVISTYRDVYENILGGSQRIYRELPSGANAGFLLSEGAYQLPKSLDGFKNVKACKSMMVKPPFMVYTESNTRKGVFSEHKLPLSNIDAGSFICVGVKVAGNLGLCYIHKHYLAYAIGLGNLFEIARVDELGAKPEFVMVFGASSESSECYYYKEDETFIGICPDNPTNDYFGYIKKMVLTLHNLARIEGKELPIHGAAIKVKLESGDEKVICLLGDSGAGKSETIEALKSLNDERIVDILTIFDDMGTFVLKEGKVYLKGTETGAFVRLDDLDKTYSLKSIDRAIFFNPDSVNSRVVIPMSNYADTNTLYPIDIFLLADNYSNGETLTRYEDVVVAKEEFILGKRMAMNTTSEKGTVSTFFANPFGPLQKESETRDLIDTYFEKLYADDIYVGLLRTRLSYESELGPLKAAQSLLDLINAQ